MEAYKVSNQCCMVKQVIFYWDKFIVSDFFGGGIHFQRSCAVGMRFMLAVLQQALLLRQRRGVSDKTSEKNTYMTMFSEKLNTCMYVVRKNNFDGKIIDRVYVYAKVNVL